MVQIGSVAQVQAGRGRNRVWAEQRLRNPFAARLSRPRGQFCSPEEGSFKPDIVNEEIFGPAPLAFDANHDLRQTIRRHREVEPVVVPSSVPHLAGIGPATLAVDPHP